MSDHFVHAYNGCEGKSGQSIHSYHSAWMSHWKRKSYSTLTRNHNCSSSSTRNNENLHATNEYQLTDKETVSNICRMAKGLREIETASFKQENESLRMTPITIGTEKLGFHAFPGDVPGENAEITLPVKGTQGTCHIKELRPNHNLDSDIPALSLRKSYNPLLLTVAPDANETPYVESHSEPEGVTQNTKEILQKSSVFRDSSLETSRPLQEDVTRSITDMVQCGFDCGKGRTTLLPSPMVRPAPSSGEQFPRTNLHFVESENMDYRRHSTFMVCEEKIESHSNSGRSLASYMQQNKASLFQTGPSTSNNHSPPFGGEQVLKMQNFSGIRLFQNQSNLSETTKTEMLQHGSLPKFSHSLQDVETMRICTTVDSVVPIPGGQPRFSQTSHSFFITKNSDLSSYKGKQRVNRNIFVDSQRVSPSFGQGQLGVKILSLGDSSESGQKENLNNVNPSGRIGNAEDVRALSNFMDRRGKKVQDDFELKNDSSAETESMDLDDFKKKNQLSCVNSSPSNKVPGMCFVSPQDTHDKTSCEVGHRKHNSGLPDINLEHPALSSEDNVDPSSSSTQSLDMEAILARAEQPGHSEPDCSPGGLVKPDPSNRWIKRLKSSASKSSYLGTKSSNIREGSCHEKNNLSLRKILQCSSANSEPTVSKLHGKEMMVLDNAAPFARCGVSSSMDTAKNKNKDSLTSLSWIRRWCHDQSATPQKKSETVVVCEPQSSKLAIEDLEEKQFPSIAAMALMGKTMKGFQPCEFQKRGSFIVWNTGGS